MTGLKLPFWGLSFVEFWCWGLIFGGQGGPGPPGPPPGSAPVAITGSIEIHLGRHVEDTLIKRIKALCSVLIVSCCQHLECSNCNIKRRDHIKRKWATIKRTRNFLTKKHFAGILLVSYQHTTQSSTVHVLQDVWMEMSLRRCCSRYHCHYHHLIIVQNPDLHSEMSSFHTSAFIHQCKNAILWLVYFLLTNCTSLWVCLFARTYGTI